MTILERVKMAMNSDVDYDEDTLDKLITMAYHIGYEQATRYVSGRYAELIAEQRERAYKSRYHRMANAIIGDKDFIYTSGYAMNMTKTFGIDETVL